MATANDFQKTAESVWNALDKLSVEHPEEYKRFIDQQLKEGPGLISPPEPAYCLACSIVYKGNDLDLFINMCKWAKLPAPKGDSDPIPVKGGILRHVVEKGKKMPSLLYDVAFNPTVIDECTPNPKLRELLHSLILDFVTDMLNVRVNRDSLRKVCNGCRGSKSDLYHSMDGQKNMISQESQLDLRESILEELSRVASSHPKEKKLPPLRLEPQEETQQRRNLIEELPSTPASNDDKKRNKRKKNKQKTSKQEDPPVVPQYTMATVDKSIVIAVELPGIDRTSDVDLETSEDDVLLTVINKYSLKIDLPNLVDPDQVTAEFNKSRHKLTVTLPLLTPIP